jgi:hypothetical protein
MGSLFKRKKGEIMKEENNLKQCVLDYKNALNDNVRQEIRSWNNLFLESNYWMSNKELVKKNRHLKEWL